MAYSSRGRSGCATACSYGCTSGRGPVADAPPGLTAGRGSGRIGHWPAITADSGSGRSGRYCQPHLFEGGGRFGATPPPSMDCALLLAVVAEHRTIRWRAITYLKGVCSSLFAMRPGCSDACSAGCPAGQGPGGWFAPASEVTMVRPSVWPRVEAAWWPAKWRCCGGRSGHWVHQRPADERVPSVRASLR
jgi:hypothetical protein